MPRKPDFSSKPTSEGVRKLRELTGGIAELAKNIGVGVSTVSDWRTCKKTPNQNAREKISKAYPQIRPDDWEGASPAAKPAKAKRIPKVKPPPLLSADPSKITNKEAADKLLAEIQAAKLDPDITTTTRKDLAAAEIRCIRLRKDLDHAEEVTLDKLARSDHWERVSDEVLAAVCDDCTAKLAPLLRRHGAK